MNNLERQCVAMKKRRERSGLFKEFSVHIQLDFERQWSK